MNDNNPNTNPNMNNAPVIGISRHRLLSDGHGVTTLVAFHGCPLHCRYCINQHCHDEPGKCEYYTPESLYERLKLDDIYFRATGGGVTFGGGEPLLRAPFIRRFRELCGALWRITVETSMQGDESMLRYLADVVDEWIVDIKTSNAEIYKNYTDGDYAKMEYMLHMLTERLNVPKDRVVIRIPIIPEYTEEKDVEVAKRLYEERGFKRFDIFTYRTTPPTSRSSLIKGLPAGKALCEVLKAMRRQLAADNGISMPERKCTHEGDCPGTCPMCESELKILNAMLSPSARPNIRLSGSIAQHIDILRDKYEGIEAEVRQAEPNSAENSAQEATLPTDENIGAAQRQADEIAASATELEDHTVLGMMKLPRIPKDLSNDAINGNFEKFPAPGEIGGVIVDDTIERHKRIFFKECAVAGVSFHVEADDELWDELYEGAKIALVRHRSNKYDPNAVAVALADDFDGDHDNFDFDFILGYLPRNENTEIAAMMDAGFENQFVAEISTLKRHGALNNRIRITIWLLSKEAEKRPSDLLRLSPLSYTEMEEMTIKLQERGLAHFRWRVFPPSSTPIYDGEEVVLMCIKGKEVIMYRMRIMASDGDVAHYIDDYEAMDDSCMDYVLSNIAGPIFSNIWEIDFLNPDAIHCYDVLEYLDKEKSDTLKELMHHKTGTWISDRKPDILP